MNNIITNQREIYDLVFVRDLIFHTDFGRQISAEIRLYYSHLKVDIVGEQFIWQCQGFEFDMSKKCFYIVRFNGIDLKKPLPISDFQKVVTTLIMQDIIDK